MSHSHTPAWECIAFLFLVFTEYFLFGLAGLAPVKGTGVLIELLKRHWYTVHLKGRKLSLVARKFLDFILTESH